MRTHPKIATAGPAAAWLWFCGICYCREHLTDGFIPKQVVQSLAMNLASPFRHAARLVEVKLWEDAMGGYIVHDFLDWNPSRASVLASRKAEADRKRHERECPAGQIPESARTNPGVRSESSCVRAGDAGLGSVSGSEGLGSSEESARETALGGSQSAVLPAHVRTGGAGFRPDSLVSDHRRCDPAAADACARGICVPAFLVGQWRRQSDPKQLMPDVVTAEIGRFVREAMASLPDGPIGDDPLKFWRASWSARHGSQAPASAATRPAGKGSAVVQGVTRGLERYAARKAQEGR